MGVEYSPGSFREDITRPPRGTYRPPTQAPHPALPSPTVLPTIRSVLALNSPLLPPLLLGCLDPFFFASYKTYVLGFNHTINVLLTLTQLYHPTPPTTYRSWDSSMSGTCRPRLLKSRQARHIESSIQALYCCRTHITQHELQQTYQWPILWVHPPSPVHGTYL